MADDRHPKRDARNGWFIGRRDNRRITECLADLSLSAFASAATAFDIPARQSLMPSLVPILTFQMPLVWHDCFQRGDNRGPALAGFMLAGSGPAITTLSTQLHSWLSLLL
jgi:hypothetical protein